MPSPSSPEGQWPKKLWVCPECDAHFSLKHDADAHAAVVCYPDSWPWTPVEVIPVQSSEATRERLHEAERLLAITKMEREWLLGAWAAACGIPQYQAEADMLAWSAKWRETAAARAFLATREDQE